MWIGVLKGSERAYEFWKKIGFVDVESQPYVASNSYETTVVLMKKILSGEGQALSPVT